MFRDLWVTISPFALILFISLYLTVFKKDSPSEGHFHNFHTAAPSPGCSDVAICDETIAIAMAEEQTAADGRPREGAACGNYESGPSEWMSFDSSMSKATSSFVNCYSKGEGRRWKWLKSLYERGVAKQGRSQIPKTIHQIWIGGPLPEKYKGLQKSWKEKNPDWEYRLWTDADLAVFPFTDRERFERAINVGEKSDILRYDILLHYGGLYVDTDFECLKSFDPIHSICDFYTGLEAAFFEDQEPGMGNALIGSVPDHPILRSCLKDISKNAPGTTPDEVMSVSGPGCLRKAFFKESNQKGFKNIAFPYTYFYPIPSPHRRDEGREKWIEPESFGVHYWDVSWAK